MTARRDEDEDTPTSGEPPPDAALEEESVEDLYERAPCGYLSTLPDGTVTRVNATLLSWLGRSSRDLVGRRRFTDLLSAGGRLYHETHFAPLLRMQGEISGIALELRTADGGRLPVLVSAVTKTADDGSPRLIRITLTNAEDRRSYEKELLRRRRLAEKAHRRAERDRARLQEVLAVLQESLLPPSLPAVPGLETATHYHTASRDNLGGDFYDLFDLGDGQWAFFLGDVAGKGPEAAAVTSLTRYTLRAAAIHDPEPVSVLTTLNTVLYERYSGARGLEDDARFCTAVYGILEPADDGFAIRLASGGHHPALVLRADGACEHLETPGGTLVGALPTADFAAARTALRPGDTLVLYSDGIVEARTDDGRYGEEALAAFAAALAPAGAEQVCKAFSSLLEDFGERLEDDTALLVMGVPAAARPGR